MPGHGLTGVSLGSDVSLDEGPFQLRLPVSGRGTHLIIGQAPGLVAAWPRDPLPSSWQPIWVLQPSRRRKGRRMRDLTFVGELDDAYPLEEPRGNRQAVKQWRESIWVNRKRIEVPQSSAVSALWAQYLEVARAC